jgi:hypothetical protein
MTRAAWLIVLAAGCSTPSEGDTTLRAPARSGFEPVSDVLHAQCGSLDCHGATTRNLRIHGMNGLRLAAGDVPGGEPTTPAEHDANYGSVVALEPETMDEVVREGGAHPERLTLVRKARGSEHHEGRARWHEGEAGDRCLVSWLVGAVDTDSCAQAAVLQAP